MRLSGKSDVYISVKISGDSTIKQLNKKFRNKDAATDVLSFNVDTQLENGAYYLGDVIVNKQQAKRQAAKFGNTHREEIAELVAHGVLHLLGVHHKE